MRVHIGSDHAGFELKNHLVAWLPGQGHEPIDHGPYEYDAEDDYPPFCLRAAEAVVADPGSLGIVIGGSGNGEQIAANKVDGVRAALAWSTETAELGPAAQRRQRRRRSARGCTASTRPPAFVETFLTTDFTGEERHARRIAMLADYEDTGWRHGADLGVRRRGQAPMPEGHTLYPPRRRPPRSVPRPAGPRDQPAGPLRRGGGAHRRARARDRRSRPASTCSLTVRRDDTACVHVHLGLIGVFLVAGGPAPEPVGAVRLRLENDTAYADLRGATNAS